MTQEPEDMPHALAVEAEEVMSRILYLPVYPAVSRGSIRRLAGIVTEFVEAEPPEVVGPLAPASGPRAGPTRAEAEGEAA